MTRALYYGDNLEVLRDHIADETIDLIYLDPPFNSKRDYNLLFRSPTGHESDAQITAFEDTWHWGDQAEREYDQLLHQPNTHVAEMMRAFRGFLSENDVMAYLTMMANRLLELHRVLKPTGSLYLHCDPTASHYIKVLLDAVFDKTQFINELVWQRTLPHGNVSKKFGASHDVILFYKKSDSATWNGSFAEHRPEYLEQFYKHREPDGRIYRLISCINPNPNRQNLTYEWKGVTKVWKFTRQKMKDMDESGFLVYSKNGVPSYKGYLDMMRGTPMQDIWSDIPPLMGSSDERLGYPTQKPLALLERIIQASSNEGDLVLDPFCGCGTAVHAAEKLKRQWIGIDITHLAISLIEKRLRDAFPNITFEVHGAPKDAEGAADLARRDKYQFQWWACSLVNAQPWQGKKKGADRGIDGLIFFSDEHEVSKKIVVSVKGGETVNPAMIRDLRGVMEREKAEIGLFVTLAEPTAQMRAEAAAAGLYHYKGEKQEREFPRIQILTVRGLLDKSERPEYVNLDAGVGFKKAKRETTAHRGHVEMELEE